MLKDGREKQSLGLVERVTIRYILERQGRATTFRKAAPHLIINTSKDLFTIRLFHLVLDWMLSLLQPHPRMGTERMEYEMFIQNESSRVYQLS